MCWFDLNLDTDEPVFASSGMMGVTLTFGRQACPSKLHMSRSQAEALAAQLRRVLNLAPPADPAEAPAKDPYPLDTAWRLVDAEGGPAPHAWDREGLRKDGLIAVACEAIKKLGGMDPQDRARLAALSAQPSEHLVAA